MICAAELRVKSFRSVLITVAGLVMVLPPFGVSRPTGQTLQRGIGVELPATRNAVSLPDADRSGALIVAITRGGSVYLGTDPIAPSALADRIRQSISGLTVIKIYIKADARAPYAIVANVIGQFQKAGVSTFSFLTAQRDDSGIMPVPPKGLAVRIGRPDPSLSPVSIRLVGAGLQSTLKVNGKSIPEAGLRAELTGVLRDRVKKTVSVQADGRLPFVEVVKVMDIARSAGADVYLVP